MNGSGGRREIGILHRHEASTDCELKQISGNNKDYIYKGNYHTQ